MAELLEGEVEVAPNVIMTGREWAGVTLQHVGEYCEYGSFPHTVSAFDLGRALGRSLTNCNEPNALAEVIRGTNHYRDNKERKTVDR